MTTRDHAPLGAPCWVDLWTSDVEGSRTFYGELLGWEAQEPSPEFGGYFMWHRDGVPVAGGMGPMGDMAADNRWKVYLASADAAATAGSAAAHGGSVAVPVMPVADLGNQTVLLDPTGIPVGAWEAGTFPGFTVLDEPGAPAWFEVFTGDFAATLEFYREVFGWRTEVVGDSADFRYHTLVDPADGTQLAGVMDVSRVLTEGEPGHWNVYWGTADVDASADLAIRLGGAVVDAPADTPYGRMATVTDPAGAPFHLRTPPGA